MTDKLRDLYYINLSGESGNPIEALPKYLSNNKFKSHAAFIGTYSFNGIGVCVGYMYIDNGGLWYGGILIQLPGSSFSGRYYCLENNFIKEE